MRQQKRKIKFTFLSKPESAKLGKSLLCKFVNCLSEGIKKLNCCQEETKEDTLEKIETELKKSSNNEIDFHKTKQTDPEKERYSRPENTDMDKVRLADKPYKPRIISDNLTETDKNKEETERKYVLKNKPRTHNPTRLDNEDI